MQHPVGSKLRTCDQIYDPGNKDIGKENKNTCNNNNKNNDEMVFHKYRRTSFDDSTENYNSNNDMAMSRSIGPGVSNYNDEYVDPEVIAVVGGVRRTRNASASRKRSSMEIVLMIMCVIMVIGITVLTFFLIASENMNQEQAEKLKGVVCTTPSCVLSSSNIINDMDLEIEPCDDFYKYACGNWKEINPIPEGNTKWGTFEKLTVKNHKILNQLLESNITMSGVILKTREYYDACMDQKKIEAKKETPLLEFIRSIGTWNALEPNKSLKNWEFQPTMQKLHSYGYFVFFSLFVAEDQRDSSKNIIHIEQGSLSLKKERYSNSTKEEEGFLKDYLSLTAKLILMIKKQNFTRENIIPLFSIVKEVYEFESEISKISMSLADQRASSTDYTISSPGELNSISTFINWTQFLNESMKVAGHEITKDTPLMLHTHGFLTKISDLIQRTMTTEQGRRTINNYMHLTYIKTMIGLLSSSYQDIEQQFNILLTGGSQQLRWSWCTSETVDKLGFALGALYINVTLKKDSKEKTEVMIKNIKTAFVENLEDVSWIDESTKKNAVDKADMIKDKISYPEFIFNDEKLNEYYQDVDIHKDKYFENNINFLKLNILKNFRRIKEKTDRNAWYMDPTAVNAYYSPINNEIVFPAGILQPPFYSEQRSKSLNYGAIGAIMGHELTHGFDDLGSQFDKHGNKKQWWSNASLAEFKRRTKCFIDQYSQYDVYDKKVNGEFTLGENIADIGGLKASLNGYRNWVKDNGQEKVMPGLNLNHDQLFFLGFSQLYCSEFHKNTMLRQLNDDPHTPSRWRVIGALRNSKEFRRAFSCEPGDFMYSEKICDIW